MKKFGFTLAELLVALTIVAVASALMAPAITNIMPDKYKTRVLKYYSMVANATNDMLDNELIYYAGNVGDEGNWAPSCIGLECTSQPIIAPYNNGLYTGSDKYKNILVDMLNLERSGANYVTPDGTVWNFSTQAIPQNGLTTTITLNFVSDRGNCNDVFPTCDNPHVFRFRVNRGGDVFAGDAMTDAYLRNPTNRDKRVDKETALNYLNDATKNVNYGNN